MGETPCMALEESWDTSAWREGEEIDWHFGKTHKTSMQELSKVWYHTESSSTPNKQTL